MRRDKITLAVLGVLAFELVLSGSHEQFTFRV